MYQYLLKQFTVPFISIQFVYILYCYLWEPIYN